MPFSDERSMQPSDRPVQPRWTRHWHERQKLRFLVVGAWNTVFGYLCFIVLYALLHDHVYYLLIGILAHAIAVGNAFVAHRLLVFKSREKWLAEFVRFNVAQLAVLGCGLLALWLLVSIEHLSPLIAQGLVTIGTVIVSYLAHRSFSFAGR